MRAWWGARSYATILSILPEKSDLRGSKTERRSTRRIQTHLRIRLTRMDERHETHSLLTRDISASGAFIETELRLDRGDLLGLTIDPGDSRPKIALLAEVVRASAAGLGVRFVDTPYQTLRRYLDVIEAVAPKAFHDPHAEATEDLGTSRRS